MACSCTIRSNDILRMLSCDNSDYRKRRNRKAKVIKNIPVNERQAFTVYLTNRFQIAVRLFTATWNLLVLYNKELKKSFNDDVIYASVLQ